MSGRVPPGPRAKAKARRNPSRDVARAGQLFERFTAHDPMPIASITVPPLPKAVAVIGELDAVEYTTVRAGKVEAYRHDFADGDRALLCVSPDGRQLLIVGGRYKFTARGIVDLSDRKHLKD